MRQLWNTPHTVQPMRGGKARWRAPPPAAVTDRVNHRVLASPACAPPLLHSLLSLASCVGLPLVTMPATVRVVEDEVKKLLAAADLATVTVKMLAAQVQERLPDVRLEGKPLRQVVRAAVDAYMAAREGRVGRRRGKAASGGSDAEAAAGGGGKVAASGQGGRC
eukprot:TRINITY_DN12063_c0_g1_i1.p1 TRINITY_DN12063_c0_g1~~TRINITY_DN12063_c0_g1_i1.p1  ORF type:complete len:164 (+),score=34.42 TRINITY_DN12063_c0_g1_i1:133-624(+)